MPENLQNSAEADVDRALTSETVQSPVHRQEPLLGGIFCILPVFASPRLLNGDRSIDLGFVVILCKNYIIVVVPVLKTKFHKPIPPLNSVNRQRLWEQLEEGLSRNQALILIAAPARYGKTTLISGWLREVDMPCTWLSMDEDDNDLGRFITYFVGALQEIEPDFGRSALSLMKNIPAPGPEPLATVLINEVLSLSRDFVLVLDDYHTIHLQQIHRCLELILKNRPPNLHLVLVTRQNPPLAISRLRVRGQITEIRTA